MANALRRFREAHKLTQDQIGAMAGVKKAAVSKWEEGVRIPPMRVILLEENSHGELPRWELRPDLWEAPSTTQSAP